MGCLLILLAVIVPRITMVLIFLFTKWFSMVFHSAIWPILGFIFMPYTTLAYLVAMIYNHQISNGWLILIIIAVVVDLGSHTGFYSRRRY